ncbi:unnamed protein product [Ceratitis capitata]|uniref:(Mediterranean fruit fly) hypothetical protein n=1 Tax=Ceratitis capitata TaxID=7213 RepID=A0A811UWN8_CERCA|nr:unnamed protein product [Ceratitis capitata]
MLNTDDPIELSDDSVDCSSTTVLDMLPSNNRKELNLLFPQREDYMSISNDPTSSRDQKKSKKANKFIKNSKKKFSIPTDNLPQLDLLSTEKGGVGKLAGGSDLIPLISTGSAYSSKTIPSTSLTATVASSFSLSKTDTYPSNAFENSLSSTNIEDDTIELSDDSVDSSSTTVLDMLPSNNRKELNLLFPQREDYMSISNDPTSSRDQKKSKKANKFIKNSKKKFSIPTDNLPQLDLLSTEKGGVGKLAGRSDLIPLISTVSAYSSKTIPSTSLTATVASSFSLSKTDIYPSNAFENPLSSTNIEDDTIELSDDSVDSSSTTVLDMLPSNNRKELNLLFPQREDYMSISNDPTSSRDQKKSKKANKFIKNSKKKFSIPTDNLPQLDLLSTEKGGVGKLAGGSDLIPLISTVSAYSSKTIPSTSLTATVASSFSLSKTDIYPSNAFENPLSSTNIEDDTIELSDDSVDSSSTTVLDMLPSNNRKELNLLFPQREDYMSISNDPTSSRDQKKSKKANKFIKNSKKKFSIPTDNLPQLDLLSTEKGGVGKLAGGSDLIPLISTVSAYSSKTIPSTSLTATVASSFSLSKTDIYPSNAFENPLSSTNIEGNKVFP